MSMSPNSRPYLPKCHYCDVDFDVIGKLEDFEEDVAYIAKKTNLTDHFRLLNHVQNKSPEKNDLSGIEKKQVIPTLGIINSISTISLGQKTSLNAFSGPGYARNVQNNVQRRYYLEKRDKYMSQLSPELVRDLYDLYKIDFEMFGYD